MRPIVWKKKLVAILRYNISFWLSFVLKRLFRAKGNHALNSLFFLHVRKVLILGFGALVDGTITD